MAQATVCDKCRKVLKYASDCKIILYTHPYGDTEYDLCEECELYIRAWLSKKGE